MKKKGPELFGTSGVRGETNVEITPELALTLSKAFGTWLGEGLVVVGRDPRPGAEMLVRAISAGLQSVGLNVLDCGVLPTPALAFALRDLGARGGVMVTGSHMPPDRVGLIYLDPTASYLNDEDALKIESIYERGMAGLGPSSSDSVLLRQARFRLPDREPAVLDSIGTVGSDRAGNRIEKYVDLLKSLVEVEPIRELARREELKVVVDPGNGTAVNILSSLLTDLGVTVVPINDVIKPEPDRSPEPRRNTLASTVKCLLETGSDLGAATDVDADRVVFIDGDGEVVSEDVTGAIFGKWIFETCRGDGVERPVCVTPVNSSGLIEWVAKRYGVDVEYCKIGQPDTERALKEFERRAVYAYEESGKYYFARQVHWCDGILATLYLLQIISETGSSLRELTRQFPRFYQAKDQISCPDDVKDEIYEAVVDRVDASPRLREGKKRDVTIDGWKRIYDDDSWLLLRPSGTEPLFRLYSDAMSRERAEELLRTGRELVSDTMEARDNPPKQEGI